jgi:hypothetical protein
MTRVTMTTMTAMTTATMGMTMLVAQAAILEIVRLPTIAVHMEAEGQHWAM